MRGGIRPTDDWWPYLSDLVFFLSLYPWGGQARSVGQGRGKIMQFYNRVLLFLLILPGSLVVIEQRARLTIC